MSNLIENVIGIFSSETGIKRMIGFVTTHKLNLPYNLDIRRNLKAFLNRVLDYPIAFSK